METTIGNKELVFKLIQKNYYTDKVTFYPDHIRIEGLSITDERRIKKIKRIGKNYFGEKVTYSIFYNYNDGLIICIETVEPKSFTITTKEK